MVEVKGLLRCSSVEAGRPTIFPLPLPVLIMPKLLIPDSRLK